MPKSQFIDFKAVKSAITMEQILVHYGLLDRFKRNGDSLSGPCPIHRGDSPNQFRVSTSKNIWNCFSKCKRGGNTLDFIARMENVSIHGAALKAIDWFSLDPDAMSATTEENGERPSAPRKNDKHPAESPKSDAKPQPAARPVSTPENGTPNKPLQFRLDKLVHEHPYFGVRGISLQTLVDFGAGYCTKGMMAERIAIPIHNPEGQVVAYAGRYPGEPPEDAPKYKLPQGFKKSLELFNIDRALKEPPEVTLVIVEGFFGCMKLHQLGCQKVVALMGSTMSAAQEELIHKCTDHRSQIIVMLDEDDAGRAGREDIAVRLARFCFVKIHIFEKEGDQPENMSPEEVTALFI